MNELTITTMSFGRVLRLANAAPTTKRKVTKVNGKNLAAACAALPDSIYFEDRSIFGKGGCYSYAELKARGTKSILVRCNGDRTLVQLVVR